MLQISIESVEAPWGRDGFGLELDLRFEASTHTALIGAAGSGKTALLRVVAGELPVRAGTVRMGRQDVTHAATARRPVLLSSRDLDTPPRRTVRHAMVAALRQTALDREDRLAAFDRIAVDWELATILDRRFRDLSSGEVCRARLALIEVLRPAILLLERVFRGTSPGDARRLSLQLHDSLRAVGTTVISEIEHVGELELFDRIVVLDGGRVAQTGVPQEVLEAPASIEAAFAGGPAVLIPVSIRGVTVESPIGTWETESPPFQGVGTAIARPHHFETADGGESDFVLGVERAAFREGLWRVQGYVTGGVLIEVALPGRMSVHKGKLVPLRYDPRRFVLVRRAITDPAPR